MTNDDRLIAAIANVEACRTKLRMACLVLIDVLNEVRVPIGDAPVEAPTRYVPEREAPLRVAVPNVLRLRGGE